MSAMCKVCGNGVCVPNAALCAKYFKEEGEQMSEHKPAEYINAVYEQTIKDLKERLAAETEKVEAFRDFMETEMGWEYFRAEMMYFDDKEKQRCSEENARKLKNFLVGGK